MQPRKTTPGRLCFGLFCLSTWLYLLGGRAVAEPLRVVVHRAPSALEQQRANACWTEERMAREREAFL